MAQASTRAAKRASRHRGFIAVCFDGGQDQPTGGYERKKGALMRRVILLVTAAVRKAQDVPAAWPYEPPEGHFLAQCFFLYGAKPTLRALLKTLFRTVSEGVFYEVRLIGFNWMFVRKIPNNPHLTA
jgi:hypothetical protein